MNNTASVETVLEVKPHPNADMLELITVLGWQVVAQKGLNKEGDKVVYVRVDSVFEPADFVAFLEPRHYRVKTIKLRGEYSEGLILPLSTLPEPLDLYEIGDNVSEILKVKHYEKPIPADMAGIVEHVGLPAGVPKTDAELLQNYPDLLIELEDSDLYVSTKQDGTSVTFTYTLTGGFKVSSRNQTLLPGDSVWWRMAKKYDLENKMKALGLNIAIQGEICGPGIQKNRGTLPEVMLYAFDVFDITKHLYYDYNERVELFDQLGLTAPFERILQPTNPPRTMADWEAIAEAEVYRHPTLDETYPAEGVVVHPLKGMYSDALRGRSGFKVVSKKYALKKE